MAGHAAIAVKSPNTMMISFHRASRLSLMRVNKYNTVYYSDDREHLIMIGKHRYQLSLGPEVQMKRLSQFATTETGFRGVDPGANQGSKNNASRK